MLKVEILIIGIKYESTVCLNISNVCSNTKNIDMEKKAREWIKYNVQEKVINSIPWSEFEEGSKIGSGKFGSVFKAYWKNSHCYVAYKKLSILSDIQYKTWEAFKHELCMQIRAHSCENIVRILGISNITNLNDEYVIVMEHADGGNLKDFLSLNFEYLDDWDKKFQLALGITNGLYYLHKNGILHRDLVSTYKNKSLLIPFN